MTKVVRLPAVVRQILHRVSLGDILRVRVHKVPRGLPERRDRLAVFEHGDGECVGLVVLFHVDEGVEGDVAVEVYVRSVRK